MGVHVRVCAGEGVCVCSVYRREECVGEGVSCLQKRERECACVCVCECLCVEKKKSTNERQQICR